MVTLTQAVMDNLNDYFDTLQTGRPRKYETLADFQKIVQGYFQYIQDANIDGVKLIPDVEGLCAYMGIDRSTLIEWERTRDQSYSNSIKNVKNQLAYFKKQLALKGKIPPLVFATDFNNNHGYVQKQEISIPQINPLGVDADPSTIRKTIEALPSDTSDYK